MPTLLADKADTFPDSPLVVDVALLSNAAAALLANDESTYEENLSPYWLPPEDSVVCCKAMDADVGGLP